MAIFGSILSTAIYPNAGTNETVIPTSTQSLTIGNSTNLYVMNPAGTIALLTLTMPAAPTDNQIINIVSSQSITALTLNANSGQTILNVPTTLGLGGFCGFVYISANTKRYRLA